MDNHKSKAIIALVISILCICCCGGIVGMPFAIVALSQASKVDAFAQAGNNEAALVASTKANKFGNISLIVTIICSILIPIVANIIALSTSGTDLQDILQQQGFQGL